MESEEEKGKQLEQLKGQLQQLQQKEKLLEQQLERCEQEKAKLEKELHEIKKTFSGLTLMWKEGEKTPFSTKSWGESDAIIDGSRVYIQNGVELWIYDVNSTEWSQLPDSKYTDTSLQILNGLPTTIGGTSPTTPGDPVSTLVSLSGDESDQKWTEIFPAMRTKRKCVTAVMVCTGAVLIVAGGHDGVKELTTVEVLNIKNRLWSIAIDVPEPLQHPSTTVCGDQLYMLGGAHETRSVYTCSVSALLQTCTSTTLVRRTLRTVKRAALWLSLSANSSSGDPGVWSQLADLPVPESTCVTFCGQLLAVGGRDSGQLTTAIYMYNPSTNSWNVISHMMSARVRPFSAVLPDNQLMVVGGEADKMWIKDHSDSVEFGSFMLPKPITSSTEP